MFVYFLLQGVAAAAVKAFSKEASWLIIFVNAFLFFSKYLFMYTCKFGLKWHLTCHLKCVIKMNFLILLVPQGNPMLLHKTSPKQTITMYIHICKWRGEKQIALGHVCPTS